MVAGSSEVGVVGRVGLEVVDDHGEQVLAGEAPADLVLVGHARHRVAARRRSSACTGGSLGLEQRLAQAGHAQRARAGRAQVVAPERGPVAVEEAARVVGGAAARDSASRRSRRGCT